MELLLMKSNSTPWIKQSKTLHSPIPLYISLIEMHQLNSYPGEGNEGQGGYSSEHDCRDQHDQCDQYVVAEEGDSSQPTTEKDRKDH